MRKIPLLVLLTATMTTVWLLWPNSVPSPEGLSTDRNTVEEFIPDQSKGFGEPSLPSTSTAQINSSEPWFVAIRDQLRTALESDNFALSLSIFNQAFERANSEEVAELHAMIITKAAVLSGGGRHGDTIRLLSIYTETFDEVDAWRMLVTAHQAEQQYSAALDALLRSNQLELDPARYQKNLRLMIQLASNIATDYERNGNRLAVLELYKRLYDQYPQSPRIQFDLASAHLSLGAVDEAQALLQNLLYDPDLGSLAQQKLSLLDAETRENTETPNQQTEGPQIVVPLIRAGTSLLIDARIEGSNSRLLLDTGASITSLSTRRIEQLGLKPTGRSIRLSTANGVTTARLFRAKNLSIGRINFRELVVAEIDLSSTANIDGLLGTDVLRKMDDRYSYLIDDQRNALIFRARR